MSTSRRVRRYIITAAIASVLLALTYLVFVRTAWGQRLDDLAFDGRSVEDPDVTQRTNDLLHEVTRSTLFFLTGALVVVALARRRFRLAVAVGAAVTASVVTTEILKLHVLTRPDLDGIAGIDQNSFPSGHATIGMSLSLGIVMVAPHGARWLAGIAAAVLSSVFGIGVLATGWHRPSDTIGAYLVCVIMFCLATAALTHWRGPGDVELGSVEERLTPAMTVPAWLLGAAAGITVLVRTLRTDDIRTIDYAADYVVVCAGIVALGIAIVLGYQQSLRGVSLDQPRKGTARSDRADSREFAGPA